MCASTIQDVAKEAGVSVATVSRVLNRSASVAATTREAVQEAIKKLNYRPNLLGRNLRRAETRLILVLLTSISNTFYSKVVKGMEDVAHKHGYNIMLCNTNADILREKVYLELLENRLADGVIFMAPSLDGEALMKLGQSFPVVQCCEYKEGAMVSHVSIDNYQAASKAVNHLIRLGHRRIAMMSCENSFVSTRQREAGYQHALEMEGIEVDPVLIRYGDYSFKSGMRVSMQLLSLPNRPTAIFAISDMMAIGALRTAKESGLKVPENVAVVGFDNIAFSSMLSPMLTTISQPMYDLGSTSMELLLKQIRGEIIQPQAIFLENELVIRESTVHSVRSC